MSDGFGKYDIYAVAGSMYCYPDSDVLRNRLGITDRTTLKKVESDISAVRQSEMLEAPVKGRFSPTHLRNIHRHLLGDIYSFAGHYRYEDIAKGQTRFLHYPDIPKKLSKLLSELKQENFLRGIDEASLLERSSYYMAELNYIHPFREGNGRAIREFMRLLFLQCGYTVHWDAVDSDELLGAMIDSVYELNQLRHTLKQCIIQKELP